MRYRYEKYASDDKIIEKENRLVVAMGQGMCGRWVWL